jgi:hypothetical protein
MKGDFTRDTFDRLNHFSRVLIQQGRVSLDADFNEQASILLHYLRTVAMDLIGPLGGPGDSFKINLLGEDFSIGSGRYYVDGILCENEEKYDENGSPVPVTYLTQPDYSGDKSQLVPSFLFYLDVWERHLTYVEADDSLKNNSIREVALGGPDTATRAKIVWQVKVLQKNNVECKDIEKMPQLSTARLRAMAKQELPLTNPCSIHTDARYRGAENQLYRVEIHTGNINDKGEVINSPHKPTLKWSRENGSVIFPLVAAPVADGTSTTKVRLAHLGRDPKLSLDIHNWVELVDDDYVLQNRAEPLLQVIAIDRTEMTVTLEGMPGQSVGIDLSKHPLLRRWDHKADKVNNGTIPIEESDNEWVTLEEGVKVQFSKPGSNEPHKYRTGDYWLIPARTANGDVIWPKEKKNNEMIPAAKPPHGVLHHYAPLAVVQDGNTIKEDCRCVIKPLTTCP